MSNSKHSTVVWRIMDGKKGHEKQTQALVQGLKAQPRLKIEEFTIPCTSWYNYVNALPRPDLVIGAGHATHLPLLANKLLYGGKTVLLMKPSLPAILFDLVFVPQHDTCTSLGNVHFTEGVLSPSIDNSPDPNCGVILLGGTSRHFDWISADVIHQVQEIANAYPTKTWTVCDSPRTPIDTLASIPRLDNIVKKPWQETDESFLTDLLSISTATWVSCDSVTMLYEALGTRAKVGILMLSPNRTLARPNKLLRGIEKLVVSRRVHLSSAGFELDEAELFSLADSEVQRCAQIVARRLL